MKSRPRYVPHEWITELRDALAKKDRKALRELGRRRLEPDRSGEIRPCPLCNDTGFEHREAMTDHRHPIPVQWPCRNGCTQMTADRKGNPVARDHQLTDAECRSAWKDKTRGSFFLGGEEPF